MFGQAFRNGTAQTFGKRSSGLLMLQGQKDFLQNCKSWLPSRSQILGNRTKMMIRSKRVCLTFVVANVLVLHVLMGVSWIDDVKSTEPGKSGWNEGWLLCPFFLICTGISYFYIGNILLTLNRHGHRQKGRFVLEKQFEQIGTHSETPQEAFDRFRLGIV